MAYSFTELRKSLYHSRASLVAQSVKKLPAIQETRVQSLGREDPLEKEMTTQFNIPAWRIPWTEGATVHVDTVLGVTEYKGTEQLTLGLLYVT